MEEKQTLKNAPSLLLDSRLITGVRFTIYDYKIVRCGDYLQVYFYSKKQVRNDIKNLDINDLKNKGNQIKFDFQESNKNNDCVKNNNSNDIEHRNIIRTKLNCQRLAKANAKDWTSFITLTYAENMQDIKQAKIELNYFIKNVKKVKKDFKYIAIPEFQKRGAIHFHLLTNLSLQDNYIIIKQKDNNKYYNVKYWSKGFTSFEPLYNDLKKVIGYISKYMTKDCDSRLFGIRRFTSSQNLIKPVEDYINIQERKHLDYFLDLIQNKQCIYENTYQDNFDNDISFKEYKV